MRSEQIIDVDESLFFCDILSTDITGQFIEPLKKYSQEHNKQIYIYWENY